MKQITTKIALIAAILIPQAAQAKDWVLVPSIKAKAAQDPSADKAMMSLGVVKASKSISALNAHLVKSDSAPQAPAGYLVAEAQPVSMLAQAPNDPRYPSQWNLSRIQAPSAWTLANSGSLQAQQSAAAMSLGLPNKVVAVVDTGIDDSHPDLDGRVEDGANFVDGGDYVDDHGHGTFVASLIGAITDNGIGMAGLNPSVQLLAVKVLDRAGAGTDFGVAQGIVWAVDNGADVINLSLGTFYDSRVMHDAVDYALQNGVLVVAASGNSGAADLIYPAAWQGVLSVGASTYDDRRAAYSTYNANVSMLAPGGSADGNVDHEILGAAPGAVFAYGSGTSFAAPQVAAAGAMYLAVRSGATAVQAFAALTATADPVMMHGGRCDQAGWGRLNTARLLGMDTAPNLFNPSTLPAGLASEGGRVEVLVGAGEPAASPLNPDPSQVEQVWAFLLDADGNEVSRLLLDSAGGHSYSGVMSVPAWDGTQERALRLAFQAIDTTGHTTPNHFSGSVMQAAGKPAPGVRPASLVLPKMQAYANPSPVLCVQVTSTKTDTFRLKVYDLSGRLVSQVTETVQAGENRFCINEVLASGIYLAMGEQVSQKHRNVLKVAIKR